MNGPQQLETLARKVFWWQPPEVSLANTSRFLAQVMTLGTWDEVKQVEKAFGVDAYRDALVNAPAGVFDARSWAYWHVVFGLPEAALPRRSLT
jgi:energy-converting hydrogenase Eha subunit A